MTLTRSAFATRSLAKVALLSIWLALILGISWRIGNRPTELSFEERLIAWHDFTTTADGPRPAVGLYWYDSKDPTTSPGMSAPLDQLLVRTDSPSIYYKSGAANTAWTLIGTGSGGGGGGNLSVTDGTTDVDPTTTLDLDPTYFKVTDEGGGAAGVTIKSTGLLSTARYTADGSETAAGFTINLTSLGIAQPNANYNAIVTNGGMTAILAFDVVQSDNAATHIHVIPSADLTGGDVLVILIVPFVPV